MFFDFWSSGEKSKFFIFARVRVGKLPRISVACALFPETDRQRTKKKKRFSLTPDNLQVYEQKTANFYFSPELKKSKNVFSSFSHQTFLQVSGVSKVSEGVSRASEAKWCMAEQKSEQVECCGANERSFTCVRLRSHRA